MDMGLVLGSWLPMGIFFAELMVVTLSTIRIIFVSRGQKILASCLGFFEILLWLMAIVPPRLCVRFHHGELFGNLV